MPDYDETVMRRFFLGGLTEEERERVEARFLEDPALFEALCALEDDLVLARIRGDLPEVERVQFEAVRVQSPDLRRQVEETKALVAAMEQMRETPAKAIVEETPPIQAAWYRSSRFVIGVAGVAAVLVVLAAGRAMLRPWEGGQRTAKTSGSGAIALPTTATLVLLPGNPRAESPQANVFRIARGTQVVVLTLSVPGRDIINPHVTLRPVGGEPLAISGAPEARRGVVGVEVTVSVPSMLLQPGDYVLTVTAEAPGGSREAVADRFFSLVQ